MLIVREELCFLHTESISILVAAKIRSKRLVLRIQSQIKRHREKTKSIFFILWGDDYE